MTTQVTEGLIASFPNASVALVANDLTSQQPTTLDVPIQITFGAAQGSGSDPVMLSSAGALTINEEGFYWFFVTLGISRTTTPGTAEIYIRLLANGVQLGLPRLIHLSQDDVTIPLLVSYADEIAAGVVLTLEIVRDSSGTNNGGLHIGTSAIGWGTTPSAALRAYKAN